VISRSNLKLIIGIGLLTLLVVFFDQIPDLILGLLHLVYELGHTLFELFEETLDFIIETLFHTGLHETQIIVFYIMLIIAFGAFYKLIRVVPRWCGKIKQSMAERYSEQKAVMASAWQQLSLFGKIKWITLLMAGLYGLSFLFF